jgi:hypothetical protein
MAGPIAAQGLGHYPVEELGFLDPSKLEVDIAGSIDPVLLGSAMSKMHTMNFDQFIPQDSDDD